MIDVCDFYTSYSVFGYVRGRQAETQIEVVSDKEAIEMLEEDEQDDEDNGAYR